MGGGGEGWKEGGGGWVEEGEGGARRTRCLVSPVKNDVMSVKFEI